MSPKIKQKSSKYSFKFYKVKLTKIFIIVQNYISYFYIKINYIKWFININK